MLQHIPLTLADFVSNFVNILFCFLPACNRKSLLGAGLPDDFEHNKPNLQEIKPKIKPNQKSVTFC